MTVIARSIVSTPVRSAVDTWKVIQSLLAPDPKSDARLELESIAGIAASLISSESTAKDPIVVSGSGPRIRVYCLFGEDAVTGDQANEDPLAASPTAGDWFASLPSPPEDFEWVKKALAQLSRRVSTRKLGEVVPEEATEAAVRRGPYAKGIGEIDKDSFLKP